MALSQQAVHLNGRRVMIASYVEEEAATAKFSIRKVFPSKGTELMGATCDGMIYQTTFAGKDLEATYNMVRAFLKEEGYEDIPLPANVEELCRFRFPNRNRQVLLFEDNGYVHNPVKILFPLDRRKKSTLLVELYNEAATDHLLRFHNKL